MLSLELAARAMPTATLGAAIISPAVGPTILFPDFISALAKRVGQDHRS